MSEKLYTQAELDGKVKAAVDNTNRYMLTLISRYAEQFRDQSHKLSVEHTQTGNATAKNKAMIMFDRVNNLAELRMFLKNEFQHNRG